MSQYLIDYIAVGCMYTTWPGEEGGSERINQWQIWIWKRGFPLC